MLNGKLSKQEEEEQKRRDGASSPLNFKDAIRLPNISLKDSNTFGTAITNNDGYASPTNLLSVGKNQVVYDNLKLTNDESEFI